MIKDLENEIWKDIPGYVGLYQVSNLGRVKSLDRFTIRVSDNAKVFYKGTDLKFRLDRRGYLNVQLSKNGIVKKYRIHRLVALSFIQNPDNLPCVNHKDECKTNNIVSNLEWCSIEFNLNYGTRNKRISKTKQLKRKNE